MYLKTLGTEGSWDRARKGGNLTNKFCKA